MRAASTKIATHATTLMGEILPEGIGRKRVRSMSASRPYSCASLRAHAAPAKTRIAPEVGTSRQVKAWVNATKPVAADTVDMIEMGNLKSWAKSRRLTGSGLNSRLSHLGTPEMAPNANPRHDLRVKILSS